MNWKAGDRAIICGLFEDVEYNGLETTLLGPSQYREGAWLVDVPPKPSYKSMSCSEANLRKPYDGYEKVSWENSVWQPKELVTNE